MLWSLVSFDLAVLITPRSKQLFLCLYALRSSFNLYYNGLGQHGLPTTGFGLLTPFLPSRKGVEIRIFFSSHNFLLSVKKDSAGSRTLRSFTFGFRHHTERFWLCGANDSLMAMTLRILTSRCQRNIPEWHIVTFELDSAVSTAKKTVNILSTSCNARATILWTDLLGLVVNLH